MAVKIRLKRLGKIRAPYYRIVVVDSRKKRDGRVIEEVGKYHPTEEPSFIKVESERVQYWLSVGAQPSDAVAAILKITGDWQTFKGIEGQEGTLRVAEAKSDPGAAIEAAEAAAEKRKAAASDAAKKAEKAEKSEKAKEDEVPADTAAETSSDAAEAASDAAAPEAPEAEPAEAASEAAGDAKPTE